MGWKHDTMDATLPTSEAEALTQIVYASAATSDFDEKSLAELLDYARARNARHGLTGMLLHVEGSFIQVLEGDADEVEAAFGRIRKDPRHGRVVVLTRGPIETRRFANWAMGYAAPAADKVSLDGFSDYLRSSQISHATEAALGDRVLELLDRFRDGAFRS